LVTIPIVDLFLGLIFLVAVSLLNLAFELIALSSDHIKIIISEFSPLLLDLTLNLLPVVPIRSCLLLIEVRTIEAGLVRSDVSAALCSTNNCAALVSPRAGGVSLTVAEFRAGTASRRVHIGGMDGPAIKLYPR
jgi:hypothetical protein